jgi:hypothetical protein
LPAYFIRHLTEEGDRIYDPFMGRGTTPLEAALAGRVPVGNDANPLSILLTRPRLNPPTQKEVVARLQQLRLDGPARGPASLRVFYHPETLRELANLREYFRKRETEGTLDPLDDWIRMVAVNRLTGHSKGFFSVYTLPPNQAASVASQKRINRRLGQTPPRRDVRALLQRKSAALLRGLTRADRDRLGSVASRSLLLTGDAAHTPAIRSRSVSLIVTSPPFLDVVNYAQDNWLRNWFCRIDTDSVDFACFRSLSSWEQYMGQVFRELARILTPEGHIAFEVGEVRKGKIPLEESVVGCGLGAGLKVEGILVNAQRFTKTSNCWGITNGQRGTNTNRIVLFSRR